ncbi:hypothetical protein KSC_024070 [Ktedonobacter sp. SOSP1-52]|nr:hypothetical protein KSC_024070 [Ktedonobacter sp. SOSP1-52]
MLLAALLFFAVTEEYVLFFAATLEFFTIEIMKMPISKLVSFRAYVRAYRAVLRHASTIALPV